MQGVSCSAHLNPLSTHLDDAHPAYGATGGKGMHIKDRAVQGGSPVQRSGCLIELARVRREEELLGRAAKLPELHPDGSLHSLVGYCRQDLREGSRRGSGVEALGKTHARETVGGWHRRKDTRIPVEPCRQGCIQGRQHQGNIDGEGVQEGGRLDRVMIGGRRMCGWSQRGRFSYWTAAVLLTIAVDRTSSI